MWHSDGSHHELHPDISKKKHLFHACDHELPGFFSGIKQATNVQ